MTYFYNSQTGGFANESPPAPQYFTYEVQLHLGNGWHAYGSLAEMNAAIAANNWPPADGSKGLLSAAPAPAPTSGAVHHITGAATSVGDFLSRLTSANLWMRIGEVVAGLILLGIGLNAMLKGRPLQVVTTAAGHVGKVVP